LARTSYKTIRQHVRRDDAFRGFIVIDNLDWQLHVDGANESISHRCELKHVTAGVVHEFSSDVKDEALLPETWQEAAKMKSIGDRTRPAEFIETKEEREYWKQVVEYWIARAIVASHPALVSIRLRGSKKTKIKKLTPEEQKKEEKRLSFEKELDELRRSFRHSRHTSRTKTARHPLPILNHNVGTSSGTAAVIRQLVEELDPSYGKPNGARGPFLHVGDFGTKRTFVTGIAAAAGEEELKNQFTNVDMVPGLFHWQLNLLWSISKKFYGSPPFSNPAALSSYFLPLHRRHLNLNHPDYRTTAHLLKTTTNARILDCVRFVLLLSCVGRYQTLMSLLQDH
jgi:hypothetical protein